MPLYLKTFRRMMKEEKGVNELKNQAYKAKIMLLLACVMFTLTVLSACAEAAEPPAPESAEIQGPEMTQAPTKPEMNAAGMPLVPDFTLESPNGPVSLSDFEGKQVVLYFWASWCPACKAGMPEKQALYDWMTENDIAGTMLAINLTDGAQETRDTCDAYIKENGYTFPVLYEEDGSLANMFGITAIPVTVVIDAEGYMKGGTVGSMPIETIQGLLEQSL